LSRISAVDGLGRLVWLDAIKV